MSIKELIASLPISFIRDAVKEKWGVDINDVNIVYTKNDYYISEIKPVYDPRDGPQPFTDVERELIRLEALLYLKDGQAHYFLVGYGQKTKTLAISRC